MQYQLFDALTPDEYANLKADIAQRGVLVPVEVDETGAILDGHHRVKAWQELKTEGVKVGDYPRIVRGGMSEEQKRNHVRALNILRRHLSKEQIHEQMRQMRQDGATYQEIARASGVSYGQAHAVVSEANIKTDITASDGRQRPASYAPRTAPSEPLPIGDDEYNRQQILEANRQGACIEVPPAQPDRMAVHFSSETPEWYTPQDIVQRVRDALGEITLDPCSNRGAPNVPAEYHYTADDDGLARDWCGRVYMNPPYGRVIGDWVAKFWQEYASGRVVEGIALVPARTDTDWFRLLRDCAVCFIDGRLHFNDSDAGAPFPSCAVYAGPNVKRFAEVFGAIGDVWTRWSG